ISSVSAKLTPAAWILMRTVPSRSGGGGTSARTSFSGPANSLHSTARIALPPRGRVASPLTLPRPRCRGKGRAFTAPLGREPSDGYGCAHAFARPLPHRRTCPDADAAAGARRQRCRAEGRGEEPAEAGAPEGGRGASRWRARRGRLPRHREG